MPMPYSRRPESIERTPMKTLIGIVTSFLIACSAAMAGEITVLSGGAIEPGLNAAAAAFQKQTGHIVKVSYNTTPQGIKRITGGDVFDVVIYPPAAIEQFAKAGKVDGERV